MAESYPNGLKTLREKEKLLVMSNFSFSHSGFKRHVLQIRKNQGLFGKGIVQSHNNFMYHILQELNLYSLPVFSTFPQNVFYLINPFPNDKFRLFQTERVCRRQFQI